MDLLQTAGLFAARAAEEEALFARLGRWAVDERDHEAKLLFAEQAHRHAWHASLLRERTPSVGADGGEGTNRSSPVDLLESCAGALERVVGTYLVVGPARVGAYERLLASLRPPSDGPAMRVLELVLADQRAGLTAGAGVARRLAGADEVAVVEAELRHRWTFETSDRDERPTGGRTGVASGP